MGIIRRLDRLVMAHRVNVRLRRLRQAVQRMHVLTSTPELRR
jgi:hypothetical protein